MNQENIISHKYQIENFEKNSKIKNFFGLDNLAHLLRILGGLMLFVSAGIYLFQGWTVFTGFEKSLKFLVFSIILSFVGFLLGLKVKDDKGARVLLGTSASFLPVHFAQLGAIIFASFKGKAESFGRNYSLLEFAPATSNIQLLLVTGLVVSVMFFVVYLAMNVIARTEALRLTGVYFLTSMLLLLPVRSATVIAFVFLTVLALLIYLDSRYFSKDSSLRTFEGYLARALPFISLAILIGRNYLLYPTTDLFNAAFYLLCAGAFAFIPRLFMRNLKSLGILFQSVSVLPLFSFSFYFSKALFLFEIQIVAIVFTICCFILSRLSLSSGENYRQFGILSLVLLSTFGMIVEPNSIFSIAISLLAATTALIYGFEKASLSIFLFGLLGIIFNVCYQLDIVSLIYGLNNWIVFGVIGVLVVVASSLLETKDNKIAVLYRTIKNRFAPSQPIEEDYGV